MLYPCCHRYSRYQLQCAMCFVFHDDKSQPETDILTLSKNPFQICPEIFFFFFLFRETLALPNCVMPAKTNGLSDKGK